MTTPHFRSSIGMDPQTQKNRKEDSGEDSRSGETAPRPLVRPSCCKLLSMHINTSGAKRHEQGDKLVNGVFYGRTWFAISC